MTHLVSSFSKPNCQYIPSTTEISDAPDNKTKRAAALIFDSSESESEMPELKLRKIKAVHFAEEVKCDQIRYPKLLKFDDERSRLQSLVSGSSDENALNKAMIAANKKTEIFTRRELFDFLVSINCIHIIDQEKIKRVLDEELNEPDPNPSIVRLVKFEKTDEMKAKRILQFRFKMIKVFVEKCLDQQEHLKVGLSTMADLIQALGSYVWPESAKHASSSPSVKVVYDQNTDTVSLSYDALPAQRITEFCNLSVIESKAYTLPYETLEPKLLIKGAGSYAFIKRRGLHGEELPFLLLVNTAGGKESIKSWDLSVESDGKITVTDSAHIRSSPNHLLKTLKNLNCKTLVTDYSINL